MISFSAGDFPAEVNVDLAADRIISVDDDDVGGIGDGVLSGISSGPQI